MNQILSTENNQKKKRNNKPIDLKKILIIFAIIIAVFALIIVGMRGYEIINELIQNGTTQLELLNKPTIKIEKIDNVCVLTINYDEGLDKITYYWNDQDIVEKNMNGSTTPFITQIVIPEGEYNVLNIKATGVDGSINETEQEFGTASTQETPEISWFYNEETKQIEIIAKSDKGIKNVTYQWENEEVVTIDSTEENQKELTTKIDVKRGTNEITITAEDNENNIATKSDLIQAILAPVIKVQLINNETISINVSHDMGFKKVTFKVNEAEMTYDENNPEYSKDTKTISTTIDVEPGDVRVQISVYTLEEEEKEYTYDASTQISE